VTVPVVCLCNQYDFIALGVVNIFCRLYCFGAVRFGLTLGVNTLQILFYITLHYVRRGRGLDRSISIATRHAMIRQRYAGYQHQQKPYVLPTGENNVKNSMTVNIVVIVVADVSAAAATVVVVTVQ